MNPDPEELIDAVLAKKQLIRWEGESGVRNLARLARLLGYKDSQYFGQFSHEASYGDLIQFLEDNPGAVEAVVTWIRDWIARTPEWTEALADELTEEEFAALSQTERDSEEN